MLCQNECRCGVAAHLSSTGVADTQSPTGRPPQTKAPTRLHVARGGPRLIDQATPVLPPSPPGMPAGRRRLSLGPQRAVRRQSRPHLRGQSLCPSSFFASAPRGRRARFPLKELRSTYLFLDFAARSNVTIGTIICSYTNSNFARGLAHPSLSEPGVQCTPEKHSARHPSRAEVSPENTAVGRRRIHPSNPQRSRGK
ncbi:hypothetical protein GGP42_002000 [Salinibacter ruber]|nr:hypothetical protein [Salinibacter ruber]